MNKFLLMAAVAGLALHGCSSTAHVGGLPAPRMTFENYAPIALHVQNINVVEKYEIANDPQDVSSQFVISPSDAVKRYAARRFSGNGMGNGQFNIEIEDARVHMNQIAQNNKVLSWSGVGQEDQYRVFLRLKVTPVPDQVSANASTIIKHERTLVMPSSVTLAEREKRQQEFLETLIADVDKNIVSLLDQVPAMRQ